MLDVAIATQNVLPDPAPTVLFTGLTNEALNLELRCILGDIYAQTTARSDMLLEIYTRLYKVGIEAPNLRAQTDAAKPVLQKQAAPKPA